MRRRLFSALTATVFSLACLHTARAQVSIVFDYTYDSSGFFSNPTAQLDLQAAAGELQSRLADSLSAITPGGQNSWMSSFFDPSTGTQQTVSNPSIAANTLVVYVGARDLGGSLLGLGGPGGLSGSGDANWGSTLQTRGQSGAPTTDFGPWGGAIAFNSTASWYFDPNPSSLELFAGQSDFYSVALHELGHVLGIGTAPSWNNLVVGGQFTGSASMALNGGNPLSLDSVNQHWAENTLSTLPGTLTLQEAAMDPNLTEGTRKYFTDLDWAALDDIGWDVTPVPEPQHYVLATGLGLLVFAIYRRRSRGDSGFVEVLTPRACPTDRDRVDSNLL